jgi:hypothetical protein
MLENKFGKSESMKGFSNIYINKFSAKSPVTYHNSNNILNFPNLQNINNKRRKNEQNLSKSFMSKSYQKFTKTRNIFNKLNQDNLRGKKRYTNFTLFLKREQDLFEKIKIKRNINKLNEIQREKSAFLLNSFKMKKAKSFYSTETLFESSINKSNSRKNIKDSHMFPIKFNEDKNESIILDNHKYKGINILKEIQKGIKLCNIPKNINKNTNLIKKKNFIGMKEKLENRLYNLKTDLKYFQNLCFKYNLEEDKFKINVEDKNNDNEFMNIRIISLNEINKLYNNVVLLGFNGYLKFLRKRLNTYNKAK